MTATLTEDLPLDQRLSTRLSVIDVESLMSIAREQGLTESALVRLAIRNYLGQLNSNAMVPKQRKNRGYSVR